MKSRYSIVLMHAKQQLDVKENSFIPVKMFDLLMYERGYTNMTNLLDLFDSEPQAFGIFMIELTGDLDELTTQ